MKTNYLTVSDLTADQMLELKQAYLCEHYNEIEDGGDPLWGELANADSIVPDWLIFDAYSGVTFTAEDFFCSVGV